MDDTSDRGANDGEPRRRRGCSRAPVPPEWMGRRVKIEHLAGASTRRTAGRLAAVAGAGPVVGVADTKILFPWAAIVALKLADESSSGG